MLSHDQGSSHWKKQASITYYVLKNVNRQPITWPDYKWILLSLF